MTGFGHGVGSRSGFVMGTPFLLPTASKLDDSMKLKSTGLMVGI